MPKRLCAVEGCGSVVKSLGWCGKHYQRWRNHGDPLVTARIRGDDEARFWSKVDRSGPLPVERPELGPCWLWRGSLDHGGYGWFRIGDTMQRAHRWAYGQFVAEVSPEDEVDHLCRVRACVNFEDHLEAVAPLVNTQRKVEAATRTHCIHDHELTPANTYIRPGGYQKCRVCTNRSQREYHARKRAAETTQ